ncbi:hypothetical protein BDV26DRAFT_265180 [Aspergillus bertholletiae]|uniref:Uncharacterized protein n=1 Tax=Aspergillus bertholletiae TaxID=1226010 RepID=A0A5N7B582_9EURO|nr:hypothetical protein BDV26DRAFT_265180 [Aspergillus bertholletiae]
MSAWLYHIPHDHNMSFVTLLFTLHPWRKGKLRGDRWPLATIVGNLRIMLWRTSIRKM